MYSALMLSDLAGARSAARLAEAEQRRQRHELDAARPHRHRRGLHFPWQHYVCVTVR